MQESAISVLMPVHNGAATIGVALTDLIAGLGPGDEILVMDDGSEDDTARIVRDIATSDARVRLITGTRAGLVATLNRGLTEVQYRWVARADADDRYPPSRLDAQRRARKEGVVLVTGDYTVSVNGRRIGTMPCALTHPFVVASLIHPQRVPHPGVLLDRDAVQSVGGYRDDDFPAEDLALWLRLAHVGDFVGVPSIVLDWTMRAGSITHTHQAAQRAKAAVLLAGRFPNQRIADMSPSDVRRELHAHQQTQMSAARTLLLARDLRALAARGEAEAAYKEARHAVATHPMGTAVALWQLAREKRRRDRLRTSVRAK